MREGVRKREGAREGEGGGDVVRRKREGVREGEAGCDGQGEKGAKREREEWG